MKGTRIMAIGMLALILAFSFALSSAIAQEGVTEEQAAAALLQAEEDMNEMIDAGFNVMLVNDTLLEAIKAFSGENYTKLLTEAESINDSKRREDAKKLIIAAQEALQGQESDYGLVVRKAEEIKVIKEQAFDANDLITALRMRMEELSSTVDTTEVEPLLASAEKEFSSESYDTAEEYANQGFDLLDTKAAEATQINLIYQAGRENLVNFVKERWPAIIISSIIMILIGLLVFKVASVQMNRKKLKDLKLESEILDDLIQKAQSDRFQKGNITKQEYDVKVQRYKERIIEVNKEIPIIMAKLNKKTAKEDIQAK